MPRQEWEEWVEDGKRGRDGHLYTRLSTATGGGDTLPADGGPGARCGLGIFQHAPLDE